MTFNVEVVLKGRDHAVSHECSVAHESPATWDDAAVREVLVEILRAIGRAESPGAPTDRPVVLHGFSWIVEPSEGKVIIAIEIPMGAAVAGPIVADQAQLDASITRVLRAERKPSGAVTVH